MRDAVRPIVGEEVTERLGDVWGLDEEGEVRGAYRYSGQEGLWFAVGGFRESRFFSRLLAMRIAAAEHGIRED